MAIVDYTATQVRDQLTTLSNYLAISSSTTDSIVVSMTTINGIFTTVARDSVSYPSTKKATYEFVLPSGASNGQIIRRIAILSSASTSQIISVSNIPELEKNSLVEVSFEVTFEVINS